MSRMGFEDTETFDRTGPLGRLRQRTLIARRWAAIIGNIAVVGTAANTIGRLEGRSLWRRRRAGQPVWVDDVLAPPVSRRYDRFPHVPADLSPKRTTPVRVSRVMARTAYPSTDYAIRYRTPPLSGNTINGLDEAVPRRAVRSTFFSVNFSGPWNRLERVFQGYIDASIPNTILGTYWADRHRIGTVAPRRRDVEDPAAMTEEVKALARRHGAALVGVTELRDHHRYEGFDAPFRHAIAIALPMDRDRMVTAPSHDASLEVQEVYQRVNQVAIDLARDIRAMGWPARACTNISPDASEVLHLPVAVDAGLGTLGKHGSMITVEHGSNVRLATVLTDLPVAVDEPIDAGIDDFCATCRVCTTNCPPAAIFDVKQLVRGEERWYVDFDACIPYFVEHDSCGICIQVCPWSEPGTGPLISERVLSRRPSAKGGSAPDAGEGGVDEGADELVR